MNCVNGLAIKKAHIAGETQHGLELIDEANHSLLKAANQSDFWAEMDETLDAAELADVEISGCDNQASRPTDEPFGEALEVEASEPVCSEIIKSGLSDLWAFQSPAEFGLMDDVRYLVDGLFVANQPVVIGAVKKCLKTTLSMDLAVSLASGSPFLGCFDVPKRVRVLVMTGESGDWVVRETMERICRAKGVEYDRLNGWLYLTPKLPRLFDQRLMDSLREEVDKFKAGALILDPAYKMMKGEKAENPFIMGDQLKSLDAFAQMGCTPILNHHCSSSANKVKKYQPLDLSHLTYAGFQEYFRQWFMLKRLEPYKQGNHKILAGYGGSAGQNGVLEVQLDEGPNSAIEGRDYRLTVKQLDGESTTGGGEGSTKRIETKLLRALYPDKMESVSSLHKIIGGKKETVQQRLSRELAGNRVQIGTGKKGGNECELYFLTDSGKAEVEKGR